MKNNKNLALIWQTRLEMLHFANEVRDQSTTLLGRRNLFINSRKVTKTGNRLFNLSIELKNAANEMWELWVEQELGQGFQREMQWVNWKDGIKSYDCKLPNGEYYKA